MTTRLRMPALLLAVVVLAALLTACGHSEFTATGPDIPSLAGAAGGEVTAQGTAPNRHPGGAEASWYVVSRAGTQEEDLLVGVLPFESREARDAAFTRMQHQANRLTHSVVLTWGDAVVRISRIRDRGLLGDLVRELETSGAR